MHWSDTIAQTIIERKPDKELYVVAAGISPSGSVHIGNFRDLATSYFVGQALKARGKNVRFLFSWDEYDRFRKVPKNVEAVAPDFYHYVGKSYSEIPDPFGCCESYAKHFEKEFETSLRKFGFDVSFRYQFQQYRSGRYASEVVHCLKERKKIYDIIMSFKTQDASDEERENYYPVSIYCHNCGKDDTRIVSLSDDCTHAEYECKCGHKGTIDFTSEFNCKLVWKLDWPMRWKQEGVDFEPGGKDHASIGGSYQVSKVLAKEIFDYEAPVFQGYEFIGLKGLAGKMSGSSGLNLTPETLLKIYQPEVILWLYSKSLPNKAFDFCFDDEILRQYYEFDRMLNAYEQGTADEHISDIMKNVAIAGRKVHPVTMQLLVSFGSIVNWNPQLLEVIFEKIGQPYKIAEFSERLELARNWIEFCAPGEKVELFQTKNQAYYDTLDAESKQMIQVLHDNLAAREYSLDELNTMLYAVVSEVYGEMDDKTKKKRQTLFFGIVYMLLIGKSKGPRLYLFLSALEKSSYLFLLDF